MGFDKKPKNKQEVHKMMFGEISPTEQKHEYIDDYYVNTDDVADRVYNDVKKQKALDFRTHKDTIVDEIKCGWFEGYPDFDAGNEKVKEFENEYYRTHKKRIMFVKEDSPKRKEYDKLYKEWLDIHNKMVDDAALAFYKKYSHKFDGKKVYILSYGDDNGRLESHIEHSGVFDRIAHIQISHH